MTILHTFLLFRLLFLSWYLIIMHKSFELLFTQITNNLDRMEYDIEDPPYTISFLYRVFLLKTKQFDSHDIP